MMNSRGNRNSYEHENPEEYNVYAANSKYWDFNWDHMAKYDVKAHIDYVLEETNQEKLAYVGHS